MVGIKIRKAQCAPNAGHVRCEFGNSFCELEPLYQAVYYADKVEFYTCPVGSKRADDNRQCPQVTGGIVAEYNKGNYLVDISGIYESATVCDSTTSAEELWNSCFDQRRNLLKARCQEISDGYNSDQERAEGRVDVSCCYRLH